MAETASRRPRARSKPPLVAVIGTTGVGKTDLGVELALALRQSRQSTATPTTAEVINHDSMQCYRGLDTITNKATEKEMRGVPHHLMGFLEPGQDWSVNDFLRDALAKASFPRSMIDELEKDDVLPICVGGTSYYLQHLIFPNQLVGDMPTQQPTTDSARSVSPTAPSPPPTPPAVRTVADLEHFPPSLKDTITSLPPELLSLFLAVPALPDISTPDSFPPSFPVHVLPPRLRSPTTLTPALYRLLSEVDPKSAERWHWRDIRKVHRALDIVWQGKRWEDVVQEQTAQPAEGPRFRTLIFWLFAEKESLHPRLDRRVDKMIERGLLDEIDELWQIANRPGAEPTNYSKGIYQSIGYKEFEPYLPLKHRDPTRTLENDAELRRLFEQGLQEMKSSTRQYAKRQVKWIKTKLLPEARASGNGEVEVFLLDASNLEHWQDNVRKPALDILTSFLDDSQALPDPENLSETAARHLAAPQAAAPEALAKRSCLTCSRDPTRPFMVEERDWDNHLRTRSHRMALKRAARADERQKYLEQRATG
ncbi:tRNA dimethylallyltransferase [Rhodotorula sp. JG-1b]|nr:tRNA dimethylallyltransferase [Rhodotorula sp. JG-1b]